MLLFLNCLQLLLSCTLPLLSSFLPLLLRWWECLLLGDGARGEPNIFPLLAFPGVAALEQHRTAGFFFITQIFWFSLCLTFLRQEDFFFSFQCRLTGFTSVSEPSHPALNILHGLPRTHIFLNSINHLYGLGSTSVPTPLLHMDRAGNPLCRCSCSLCLCMPLWTFVAKPACTYACLCVCWPCPVSLLPLNQESHLSKRIVLAFHLRCSLKRHIITQASDRDRWM